MRNFLFTSFITGRKVIIDYNRLHVIAIVKFGSENFDDNNKNLLQ